MPGLGEFVTAVMPYVMQVAGEPLKEAIANKFAEGSRLDLPPALPDAVAPDPETASCPFCAITKHLAIMFRYLSRAALPGTPDHIYQELAIREIGEALTVWQNLEPNDLSEKAMGLGKKLATLDVRLARTLTKAQMKPVADEVWRVSSIAMELAEARSRDQAVGEAMMSRLDRRVNTVEGQFRVLE